MLDYSFCWNIPLLQPQFHILLKPTHSNLTSCYVLQTLKNDLFPDTLLQWQSILNSILYSRSQQLPETNWKNYITKILTDVITNMQPISFLLSH